MLSDIFACFTPNQNSSEVKCFDSDGAVRAGCSVFLAVSMWEKEEARQSRCHPAHSRTGDLAPI